MANGDPGVGHSPNPVGGTAQPCHPPVTVVIREKPRVLVLCTLPGAAHEPGTLHADGSPPGGSMVWQVADPSIVRLIGSGDTASIAGLSPGTTTVSVSYTFMGDTARDTTNVLAYTVVIDRPSGDPVAAGSATNEFTYSAANPGVLTIACRAHVEPDDAEARGVVDPRVRWSIDAVGNSALAWTAADPNDATRGQGLTATARFTGLPQRHDDFGTKTVRLTLDGSAGGSLTTPIEVFWPKNATNHPPDGLVHPGGTAPNWFFYWRQVIGEGHMRHVRYGGAGPGDFARTLGMTNWVYAGAVDKRRIVIFDIAATVDPGVAGVHGRITGIDVFHNTFRHERQHVRQIATADAVVGIVAGTCWQNGWSWNQRAHNHWRLGPGRVAGAAGVCPPGGAGTLGAAGSGDASLDAAGAIAAGPTSDWPTTVPLPAPAAPAGGFIGGFAIEQEAFQQETSPEHALARFDWGDPGKNHRTRNKFDD